MQTSSRRARHCALPRTSRSELNYSGISRIFQCQSGTSRVPMIDLVHQDAMLLYKMGCGWLSAALEAKPACRFELYCDSRQYLASSFSNTTPSDDLS